MILSHFLGRRQATGIRLAGLFAVTWSVLTSTHPPAAGGRGLVVLIAGAVALAAWVIWTVWSSNKQVLTPDIWALAIAGGVLLGATPSSAAAACVFVVASVASMRVGLARAAPLIVAGILAQAISILIYDGSGLGLLAYALGDAAVALGASNVRQMRVRAEQAELLLVQTQRSHEEQLRVTRLEESARIAREIHDVLAHALAGLTIQLEATAVLVEQGIERDVVLQRLHQAHELAREGLQETRRAVGALRSDAPAAGPAIEALVTGYGADSDTPAQLRLGVDASALTGAIGEAVLRVVQEALTNVRKHAPGAAVTVTVARGSGSGSGSELLVVIEDTPAVGVAADAAAPGVGATSGAALASSRAVLASSGGGYGLRGMRERAELLGGTLWAGPAGDGWRVELRLPAGGVENGSGAHER
jgi:signal transduction histidine kinase